MRSEWVQCIVNVLSIHLNCVMFLYYWERRAVKRTSAAGKPLMNVEFDEIDGGNRNRSQIEINILSA